MYFTYVLKSIKDSKRYIGFTSNVKVRLKFHNAGLNPSTKKRRPFNLLCFREFESKIEAMRYEKYLKSLKRGRQLDIEIDNMFKKPL